LRQLIQCGVTADAGQVWVALPTRERLLHRGPGLGRGVLQELVPGGQVGA
jgi:hypothetical protein